MTRPGIDLGTVRLVAQRLNHYATPGPSIDGTWIKIWSDWQRITEVPREYPRNLKCLKYQTHFWGYVKLCLLAKQAEILCNDTAPSSLIKYFCMGMWRPIVSVTRSRRTSVLWITIEMQPLCVPSRATWCHTTPYCCSNHMWPCCCTYVSACSYTSVATRSAHIINTCLTPVECKCLSYSKYIRFLARFEVLPQYCWWKFKSSGVWNPVIL